MEAEATAGIEFEHGVAWDNHRVGRTRSKGIAKVMRMDDVGATRRGKFESLRFQHRRARYYEYVNELEKMRVPAADLLQHFTTYIGHMTLSRVLALHDLFRSAQGVAGHVADVGVFKGASSFLFAKLIQIYESESLTLCHGFDWFEGQLSGLNDSSCAPDDSFQSNYDEICRLAELQGLTNILKIHRLDLRSELDRFFDDAPHIRFRMVHMDCGKFEVVKAALPVFWNRLNKGGLMVFDQYCHEHAPGETLALHEFLPEDVAIHSIPHCWTPTAYLVK